MCHKKKDSEEKFLDNEKPKNILDDTSISVLDKCAYISLFVLPILLIVGAFYGISYFIVNMTYNAELAKGVGILLSSIITVSGVFAGFYFNKKQTYKEIVTKERIEWLHRLQNNLSEYLKLTREGKVKEEDKDKVTKLYYKIIFAINHEEDKKALDVIKIYNDYIFRRESVRNIKIRKGIIELESQDTHEVKKFTYYKYKKNFGKLRSNVEKSFAEIFKEVWEDIKEEAD
ncbi:hypothetical protein [Peptoniphilus grossensis]|uniref:hypothetical protein n=1 Tax=Peptoniphilus grossensis TaxID=1465756 RepID=UPI0040681507